MKENFFFFFLVCSLLVQCSLAAPSSTYDFDASTVGECRWWGDVTVLGTTYLEDVPPEEADSFLATHYATATPTCNTTTNNGMVLPCDATTPELVICKSGEWQFVRPEPKTLVTITTTDKLVIDQDGVVNTLITFTTDVEIDTAPGSPEIRIQGKLCANPTLVGSTNFTCNPNGLILEGGTFDVMVIQTGAESDDRCELIMERVEFKPTTISVTSTCEEVEEVLGTPDDSRYRMISGHLYFCFWDDIGTTWTRGWYPSSTTITDTGRTSNCDTEILPIFYDEYEDNVCSGGYGAPGSAIWEGSIGQTHLNQMSKIMFAIQNIQSVNEYTNDDFILLSAWYLDYPLGHSNVNETHPTDPWTAPSSTLPVKHPLCEFGGTAVNHIFENITVNFITNGSGAKLTSVSTVTTDVRMGPDGMDQTNVCNAGQLGGGDGRSHFCHDGSGFDAGAGYEKWSSQLNQDRIVYDNSEDGAEEDPSSGNGLLAFTIWFENTGQVAL